MLTAPVASANVSTDCAVLARNLRLGMSGQDVKVLQQILNKNVLTQVSVSGVGAPGSESSYFGEKTKSAVVRFQMLYKNEVLLPVGLSNGTGFVGTFSLLKLTSVCKGALVTPVSTVLPATPPAIAPVPPVAPLPQSDFTPPQSANNNFAPYIIYPSPSYALHQGAKLKIIGGGFTPDNNTIMIGSERFEGVKSVDGKTLEITLATNAAKGKFDLQFSNSKGISNKSFIVITDVNAVAPVIKSFTPTTGGNKSTITLTGENFSKEWNEVVVGATNVVGLVSLDGKTLTFTASIPVPEINVGGVQSMNVSVPLWFYVVNPNGVSGNAVFTLHI